MKWRSVFLASFVAIFGFTASASAATIVGTLNITGAVQVDATTIDWLPVGGGDGTVAVTAPQLGYFAAFGGGIDGAGFPDVTADSLDLTQGGAFPVPNFLNDFSSSSNNLDPEYQDLSYTLTQLTLSPEPACVGGESVGTSCSIGVFTVTQLTNAVTISLNGFGFFVDPTYGNSLIGTAAWSTQGILVGSTGANISTVAQVLTEIFTNQGFISASYSGNFTVPPDETVVPEPATLLTFGAGSALLALRRRRKAAKAE